MDGAVALPPVDQVLALRKHSVHATVGLREHCGCRERCLASARESGGASSERDRNRECAGVSGDGAIGKGGVDNIGESGGSKGTDKVGRVTVTSVSLGKEGSLSTRYNRSIGSMSRNVVLWIDLNDRGSCCNRRRLV